MREAEELTNQAKGQGKGEEKEKEKGKGKPSRPSSPSICSVSSKQPK
jgi:hypothetical protein